MKPLLPESVIDMFARIAAEVRKTDQAVMFEIEESNILFRLALADPTSSPSRLQQALQNQVGRAVRINVDNVISRNQILTFEERRHAVVILKDHASSLTALMNPPDFELQREALRRLRDWLRAERNRALLSVVTRLMLLDLVDTLRQSDAPGDLRAASVLAEILAATYPNESRPLFNSLIGLLGEVRIRRGNTSMSKRLADMIREASEVTRTQAPEGETKTLETLTAENSDLRASLFGLRNELELLQEQSSALQTSSAEVSTARFLAEINSGASGALLDNLMHSSRVVKQLLASGWQPQPIEVEGVIYTLTMLTDHLQRIGLAPLHEIGTTIEIGIDDLENYEYAGSEFVNADERKTVRLRSPGWRYQTQLVTKPRVVEAPAQA